MNIGDFCLVEEPKLKKTGREVGSCIASAAQYLCTYPTSGWRRANVNCSVVPSSALTISPKHQLDFPLTGVAFITSTSGCHVVHYHSALRDPR